MLTQQIAINQVKSFLKNCQSGDLKIKKNWLFGSAAKGLLRSYSDIDILLVSDEFSTDAARNIKLLIPYMRDFDDFDIKTYPSAYFEKGDPLVDEVKRTGIEIK